MVQFRWVKQFSVLALVGFLAACGGKGAFQNSTVPDDTSAAQILGLAQEQVDRHRYRTAGNLYLEVERLHPYTPEAEFAMIQAAKAFHDGKLLLESRAAANRYIDFYPRSEHTALAHYLVALSYYDQIVDIQRDQQNTFHALQALRILIEQFPDSPYAELALPKFTTALNQLAGKEMDIGRYYLKRHQYSAAIGRFDAVVNDYGDTPHLPEAMHRLVEAYLSLGLDAEASRMAAQLAERFPDSQWAAASAALISTGRQPDAGGGLFGQAFRRN